ncbi:MAG: hypothetical protein HY675_05265 [Chloroflexi bacterium]|nr:hypothetical protein [Chloroflexota bacterium]
MTEVPRYVLDASVAVKWYLPDEQHMEEANRVQEDFEAGYVLLCHNLRLVTS